MLRTLFCNFSVLTILTMGVACSGTNFYGSNDNKSESSTQSTSNVSSNGDDENNTTSQNSGVNGSTNSQLRKCGSFAGTYEAYDKYGEFVATLKLFDEQANWHDAKAKCEAEGLVLATRDGVRRADSLLKELGTCDRFFWTSYVLESPPHAQSAPLGNRHAWPGCGFQCSKKEETFYIACEQP